MLCLQKGTRDMTIKEMILKEIKDINYAYNDCSKYETIKNLLEEMEVGRKKGKWIEDGYFRSPCVCSYCGMDGNRYYSYCPYCGADMREEEEDD